MMALVVLAHLVVLIGTIKKLPHRENRYDLVVACLFLAASFTLTSLASLGIHIPNPFDAIHNLFERIGLHY